MKYRIENFELVATRENMRPTGRMSEQRDRTRSKSARQKSIARKNARVRKAMAR